MSYSLMEPTTQAWVIVYTGAEVSAEQAVPDEQMLVVLRCVGVRLVGRSMELDLEPGVVVTTGSAKWCRLVDAAGTFVKQVPVTNHPTESDSLVLSVRNLFPGDTLSMPTFRMKWG